MTEEDKDLYEELDIDKNASNEDIKKAYRKKASESHPDRKGGNKERFQAIQLAFDVLSDEERRKRYDRSGRTREEPDVRNAAIQETVALFVKYVEDPDVDLDDIDIVVSLISTIGNRIKQHQENILKENAKIMRIKKAIKAIKKKKRAKLNGDPVIYQLKRMIDGCKEDIEDLGKKIHLCNEMIEIAGNYEYLIKPNAFDTSDMEPTVKKLKHILPKLSFRDIC